MLLSSLSFSTHEEEVAITSNEVHLCVPGANYGPKAPVNLVNHAPYAHHVAPTVITVICASEDLQLCATEEVHLFAPDFLVVFPTAQEIESTSDADPVFITESKTINAPDIVPDAPASDITSDVIFASELVIAKLVASIVPHAASSGALASEVHFINATEIFKSHGAHCTDTLCQ